MVSHLTTLVEYEFLVNLSDVEIVSHAYQTLRVKDLERERDEWRATTLDQVEKIRRLEKDLEPKTQQLKVAKEKIEGLEREKLALSVEVVDSYGLSMTKLLKVSLDVPSFVDGETACSAAAEEALQQPPSSPPKAEPLCHSTAPPSFCTLPLGLLLRPVITEFCSNGGLSDWTDVLSYFCRNDMAEDIRFTTEINMMRGEMADVCEKRINLSNEMRSLRAHSSQCFHQGHEDELVNNQAVCLSPKGTLKRHEQLSHDYVDLVNRSDANLAELDRLRLSLQKENQNNDGLGNKLSLLDSAHSECSSHEKELIDRVKDLEREKDEWRATASNQVEKIRRLEKDLEPKTQQLKVAEEKIGGLKHEKLSLSAEVAQDEVDCQQLVWEFIPTVVKRLHASVEYRKSLAAPQIAHSQLYQAGRYKQELTE
nr:hypothetical protein [Tanacetum cinerariifolium]